ncbi:MAG TPA: hypothetical protein VF548_02620 [Allosphingosinicella sp.]
MTAEEEGRKRDERREWLGDPIEHGGGYHPSPVPGYIADAGCCLLQVFGSMSIGVGFLLFTFLR